jgi:hypothetical protein
MLTSRSPGSTTHIISTSALAPKPDIRATDLHYRNVPLADIQISGTVQDRNSRGQWFGKNIPVQSVCKKGAAHLRSL